MDTHEQAATESQLVPDPLPSAGLSPVLQRARRRHTWRRVMTASTWGLLLGTGLLLAQQSAGDDHAAPEQGVAGNAGLAHGATPLDASHQSALDPASQECLGADCGEPEIPLKISTAPPQLPAHARNSIGSGASVESDPSPVPDAVTSSAQVEAASPECAQVVQEMASLQAARKDASEPGLRSLIDERLNEAQTRRIFLHCAA